MNRILNYLKRNVRLGKASTVTMLLAIVLTSCDTTCNEVTYLNGEFHSSFEYDADPEYGCLCESYTYTVGSDVYETVCE